MDKCERDFWKLMSTELWLKASVLLPYSPVLLTESRSTSTAEPLKSSINHVAWFWQNKKEKQKTNVCFAWKANLTAHSFGSFLIIINKLQLDELKVLHCSPETMLRHPITFICFKAPNKEIQELQELGLCTVFWDHRDMVGLLTWLECWGIQAL